MADYTVSAAFDLIAHQRVTHPATVIATPRAGQIDAGAGLLWAILDIYHGFIETAANTNPGTFLIQTSPESTGNANWVTVQRLRTIDSTPDPVDPTNAEAAGQTLIETTVTTGFAVGDYCYFEDVAAAAEGEWVYVSSLVAATSITLIEGLDNAHAATDLVRNDAESWQVSLKLDGVRRYRVVYLHQGTTGADTAIFVRGREVTEFV